MIVTVVIIVITLLNVIVYKLRQLQDAKLDVKFSSLVSLQHTCRRFSFAEIQSATNNFDDTMVLGKGGFGKVYKGIIDKGSATVAVKRLNPMSKQGAPEFWREIDMLSKIRHSHIVSLFGYCYHGDEMMLVYEYMVGGTIADHFHKKGRNSNNSCILSWVQRLKICIGAAQGLNYLHTGMGIEDTVIHRDVKSSNILLDENWAAKIADFGLSKIGPANQSTTHVSTNIKGSYGYIDPEYILTRRIRIKSDVYSFGVVMFEVLCGRPAVDPRLDREQRGLARWARHCIKEGKLHQIIDRDLSCEILPDSLIAFEKIADQCLHDFSKKRPTMAEVVVALEHALELQERRQTFIFDDEFFFMNEEAYYDHQLKPNSYMRKQIDENIDRMSSLGYAKSCQSRLNTTKTMGLARRLRMLFSNRAKRIQGKSEKKAVSPEKAVPQKLVFFEGCSFEFELEELSRASTEVLNRGTCGTAYKVTFGNGNTLVMRRLKQMPVKDCTSQFKKQMEVMESIKHQNIVQPKAYYCSKDEKLIIYDYYFGGSIAAMLHGELEKNKIHLNWETRLKIAIGSARGIAHIHAEDGMKLVHGNIKSSNIFLNSQHYGCVSGLDFALIMSPLVPVCSPKASYQAPEVTKEKKASQPSDVYSFGILLLELLTGKSPKDGTILYKGENFDLVRWVHSIAHEDWMAEMFDSELLQYQNVEEDMVMMLEIAMACVVMTPEQRPKMEQVVNMIDNVWKIIDRSTPSLSPVQD